MVSISIALPCYKPWWAAPQSGARRCGAPVSSPRRFEVRWRSDVVGKWRMPSVAQYREGNYGDTAGGTMAQVHTEVSACGTSPHVRQDCAVWGGIQSAISALVERILWPGLCSGGCRRGGIDTP